MFKRILFISIISLTLVCCVGYYKIPNNEDGEPILNEKTNYSFTHIPNNEDLTKIDTSAYYVQIFEGRFYNDSEKQNPSVIIFHNDGYFKSTSVKYYLKLSLAKRTKNSIYYGGKYQIENNIIELERFLPSKGGKTKYYSRNISKGNIDRNKIIFDDGQFPIIVYERKYKLE